jgi:hypothetical protein
MVYENSVSKNKAEYRKLVVVNKANLRKRWQQWEKDYIINNFVDKNSYLAIATHLKRTVIAVEGMKSRLKLKSARKIKKENTWLANTLIRMRELIKICETTDSAYVKEKAKQELYTLSFKRNCWGGTKLKYYKLFI